MAAMAYIIKQDSIRRGKPARAGTEVLSAARNYSGQKGGAREAKSWRENRNRDEGVSTGAG